MTDHRPLASEHGPAIRCSKGDFITHTRDGIEAALIRFAGHRQTVTNITNGEQR
jgi:hypothetical protein